MNLSHIHGQPLTAQKHQTSNYFPLIDSFEFDSCVQIELKFKTKFQNNSINSIGWFAWFVDFKSALIFYRSSD